MSAFRFAIDGEAEIVIGTREADAIEGGAGADRLFGGLGADAFMLHRGDGADTVLDFTSGEDHLVLVAVSPWTVSYQDTPDGLMVSYGAMGGDGADHVLLQGVHQLAAGDFIFT